MITYSIIQKSQLEGALRIDAEYYQPEYLELVKTLINTKSYRRWNDIEGKFITGPFGSEFNVENYVDGGNYRYVRGKDVKEFFLLNNDNVYIPQKDFERLKKYSLQEGDILISVVGTLGNTSIVGGSTVPAIFSCKSTVFRTDAINPFYFIAYLNCKYGKNLLQRNGRGHVQIGLNIDDLKNLIIFIPSTNEQKYIADLVIQSKKLIDESKQLYNDGENLLLGELGLKDVVFEEDLSFIVSFSDVKNADRIDAEYFQPKYVKIIDKIKKYEGGWDILEKAVRFKDKNFTPGEDEKYKYLALSNISSQGYVQDYQEELGKNLPSRARRKINTGDVIISSIEGSLSSCAIIEEEFDNAICSTGFFILQSEKINPETLLILFKSNIMQELLQRGSKGTILTAISKTELEYIKIPLIRLSVQKEIAEMVKKSHEARKKSKELLEQAKREVEEMIDSASSLQVEKVDNN